MKLLDNLGSKLKNVSEKIKKSAHKNAEKVGEMWDKTKAEAKDIADEVKGK